MTLLDRGASRARADGAHGKPPVAGAGPAPIVLSALRIHPDAPEPQPAPVRRDWMDATDTRFANRCLPLLLANQAGWLIPSTCAASVRWTGGPTPDSLTVWTDDAASLVRPVSHFGQGVLTWSIPYLFRTSPGYNMLVRGPANSPKDGIQALDAIVETDWSPATFTMNWIMTRPDHAVTFAKGEPICMVVPQRRGEIEQVRPVIGAIADDTDLSGRYRRWSQSRKAFISALASGVKEVTRQGWQRDYFLGRDADGQEAPEHQMRLRLQHFHDEHD
jgi:Family of unknown function (DUF6065)